MRITKKIGSYFLVFALAAAITTGIVSTNTIIHAAGITFKDVKQKHWANNAINWAIEKNMVKGYSDGTFKPDAKVTEAEFLTMLLRLYDTNINGQVQFHWADPYYTFANGYNYILPGHSDVKLRNEIINRTQVAELVAGTEGVNLKGDDAIRYLLVFNLAKGKDKEVSIQSYHGKDNLTRAEAVQFIRNISEYGLGTLIEKEKEPTDPKEVPAISY